MASRILGFGDVVGLMKDFEGVVDQEKAERDAQRMLQGQFTFDDFLEQISMLRSMGPLQDMLEKLPFFADSMPEGFQVDEKELDRIRAIVSSMTKDERRMPALFTKQPGRIKRVAKGSGSADKDVADLLQRFTFMQSMMGSIGKQAGFLQRMPGMKQLAMANRLKDAVRTGGLEGNPMMSNIADSLLEAAVAGGGKGAKGLPDMLAGLPGMPPGFGAPTAGTGGGRHSKLSADKRKAIRKQQKKARQKSRR
jgi:signal recognition particle subunit SRP54